MKSFFMQYIKLNIITNIIDIFLFAILFLLPFVLQIDDFWDSHIFLTVFSSILGLLFYFSLIFYLYLNTVYYIPKIKILNTVKMIQTVLLLFLADLIQRGDNSYVSLNFFIVLSSIIFLTLLISNIYIRNLLKKNQLFDDKDFLNYLQNDIREIPEYLKSSKLPYYFVFFVFASLFVSSWDYYLYGLILLLLSVYARKYFILHKTPKNIIIIKSIISFTSFMISLCISFLFKDFMNQHIVLQTLVLVIPFIAISPNILNEIYYSKLFEIEQEFQMNI